MKKKSFLIIVVFIFIGIIGLFSFKSASDIKKITLVKHYTSSEVEFNNAIIICYPDGTSKKFQLLQHKNPNFEINDKMLALQLNTLIEKGLRISGSTSYGDRQLFITTYILE